MLGRETLRDSDRNEKGRQGHGRSHQDDGTGNFSGFHFKIPLKFLRFEGTALRPSENSNADDIHMRLLPDGKGQGARHGAFGK
jgi:hypothetical protein